MVNAFFRERPADSCGLRRGELYSVCEASLSLKLPTEAQAVLSGLQPKPNISHSTSKNREPLLDPRKIPSVGGDFTCCGHEGLQDPMSLEMLPAASIRGDLGGDPMGIPPGLHNSIFVVRCMVFVSNFGFL
mmetsp:Transcript_4812/g.9390  ORF Transcript_4812/g.9390 Transcript_4812/m.9390 type:complete len:131 (-) Transcript_4812:206-598(-)